MLSDMKVVSKIISYGIVMTFLIVIIGVVSGYYNLKSSESLSGMYENNLIFVHILDDSHNRGRAIEANAVQLLQPQDSARHRPDLMGKKMFF